MNVGLKRIAAVGLTAVTLAVSIAIGGAPAFAKANPLGVYHNSEGGYVEGRYANDPYRAQATGFGPTTVVGSLFGTAETIVSPSTYGFGQATQRAAPPPPTQTPTIQTPPYQSW
jgi:hypothetical protein